MRTPGWGLSVAGGFLDNLEKRTCSARLPSHSPPQRGSRGDGLRAKGVRRPAPARHGGSGELGGATAARVCGIARQGGGVCSCGIHHAGRRGHRDEPAARSLRGRSRFHASRVPHPTSTSAAYAKGFRSAKRCPTARSWVGRCHSAASSGASIPVAGGNRHRAHTTRAEQEGRRGRCGTAGDGSQRRASAASYLWRKPTCAPTVHAVSLQLTGWLCTRGVDRRHGAGTRHGARVRSSHVRVCLAKTARHRHGPAHGRAAVAHERRRATLLRATCGLRRQLAPAEPRACAAKLHRAHQELRGCHQ